MDVKRLKEEWLKNKEREFKYKELLSILKEEHKSSGRSRNYQLQDWKRYFNFYKPNQKGHKFIITEIYTTPLPKTDGRINNGKNPNSHHNQQITRKDKNFKVDEENFSSIGVYKITLDNDIYIGSTVSSFRVRFLQHMDMKWNPLVTKDMLKDGADFKIIEVMNNANEKEIRERENEYIKYYKEKTNLNVVNSINSFTHVKKKKKVDNYVIKNRYLAEALAFMGFKYYKFDGDEGFTLYGFKDTEKFRSAMNGLFDLRKRIRNS